jgi:glycosyltransferase involved in cell wall biosynthesis
MKTLSESTPVVSVVMLTYNRPRLIGRAIQSVLDQDFQSWELLVVHDGPNRETEAVMAEWTTKESRIRYLRRIQRGNIANATNYAIAHARGSYIAILDDDDFWSTPRKLSLQIEFLRTHPEYAGCGGGMIVLDQDGREKLRYLKPQHADDILGRALFANPIAHSTAVYRRSVALNCGGYNEILEGFQDWDLWLKIARVSKLYNFPEQLAYYTLWEGSGSFRQQRANTRSALTIVRRHGKFYGGYPVALLMTLVHYAYARLPEPLHNLTFNLLWRLKKGLFSPIATAPK